MENVPLLQIEECERPQSARPAARSVRKHTARRVQSARSARSARSMCSEESEDDSSLDLDFEDVEPWVQCLEEATSAIDGLRRLFEEDKETFYTMGDKIYTNLKLRFEHGL